MPDETACVKKISDYGLVSGPYDIGCDDLRPKYGCYLVFLTILMPVLIGVAALGTEGAQVLTQHRQTQAVADSAAVSVASYYTAQYTQYAAVLSGAPAAPTSAKLTTQAQAVVANYPGMSGATVTVNNPPSSGNFTTDSYALRSDRVAIAFAAPCQLLAPERDHGDRTSRGVDQYEQRTRTAYLRSANPLAERRTSQRRSSPMEMRSSTCRGAASARIRAQTGAGRRTRSISVRRARPRSI
jgi:hypothetical protein